MSHARIEEVSDSDLDSDPAEADIEDLDEDFDESEILKQRKPATGPRPSEAKASLINPSRVPSSANAAFPSQTSADGTTTTFLRADDQTKYKHFQSLYPVYFDKSRSRSEGRRVGTEDAVENPLAREIVRACQMLRLETLFEPQKIHPKDWANPGRIKVKVKGGNSMVKNKHHLYTLISKHLKENPTTPATAKSIQMPGLPLPDASKPYPAPSVPKGWKINTILPYYSPALTGGGVSDNFFKDMMQQTGGQLPPGMPDMSAMAAMMGGMGGGDGPAGGNGGEPSKKKKEKRKIIRA